MSGFFRNFASVEIYFTSRSYGKNQICDNNASLNLLIINTLCIKILLNYCTPENDKPKPRIAPFTSPFSVISLLLVGVFEKANPHCRFAFSNKSWKNAASQNPVLVFENPGRLACFLFGAPLLPCSFACFSASLFPQYPDCGRMYPEPPASSGK